MLIRKLPTLVATGTLSYVVHACGKERAEETWEGWLEFHPSGMGSVLWTEQETSQPNPALEYWADGLEPVYLEGALARAEGRLL